VPPSDSFLASNFMPIGILAMNLKDSSAFLQAEVLTQIGGSNLGIVEQLIGRAMC